MARETIVLDVTRLVSRQPRRPTGIDRVEEAWLRALLASGREVRFLLRAAFGYMLLGPDGGQRLLDGMDRRADWAPASGIATRAVGLSSVRRQVETTLAAHALGRCQWFGLAGLLRRNGARGGRYLNLGHSNLTDRTLRSIRRAGLAIDVLVHDAIPLTHPAFAGPGIPDRFRRKMSAALAHADRLIHTAAATRVATERALAPLGRVPPGQVAPLGLTLAAPDDTMPAEIAPGSPFFLAVGTLEPRKNLALLLQVWEALAQELPPDACPQLVLVGARGWLAEADWQAWQRHPLTGRLIHILHDVEDGTLATLYSRARALLMPSFVEGYGLPPLEAAAHGCPLILSDLPVYRDTLGELPIYLKPTEMYSWKETIKQMLAEPRQDLRFIPPRWADHFEAVLGQAL